MTSDGTFTCVVCGVANGRTANDTAFNSCQACGASVHTMFGTTVYQPCGGIMTVVNSGTATISGASVAVERFKCACGWSSMFPTDTAAMEVERSHGRQTLVRLTATLNPGFCYFEQEAGS